MKLLSKSVNKPFMPKTTAAYNTISLKNGVSTSYIANTTTFFSVLQADNSYMAKSGAQISASNSTARQVIIEINGQSGTLTTVISPTPKITSDISIFVTVDGVEYEYQFKNLNASYRAVLGGFSNVKQDTAPHDSPNTIGSYKDEGFLQFERYILNPVQAMQKNIGVPFKKSLKVEVQLPNGVETTNARSYCGVAYATC
jgi:hypothetical protein